MRGREGKKRKGLRKGGEGSEHCAAPRPLSRILISQFLAHVHIALGEGKKKEGEGERVGRPIIAILLRSEP